MTKYTYINASNKHAVRNFLFSYFRFNSVVGLAGPDINEYLEWCESRGYNNIEVWENEPSVMLKQLSEVKTPVRYRFGNILDASFSNNVLFDLDYCVSIRYMKEHLQKFKDNFIMTFSTRIGVQETIDKFFEYRGETIIGQMDITGPGLKNKMIGTNLGMYIFITYFDTSAMCCFAKIN